MRQRTPVKVVIYSLLVTAIGIAIVFSFPQPSRAISTGPLWIGTFNNGWQKIWGVQKQGQFGQDQMRAIPADASFPFPKEHVLQVTYGAGSSANSCSCPSKGGAQFYASPIKAVPSTGPLFLLFYLKFNNDAKGEPFDWGKAGKLPGLWGGPISTESGGRSSSASWSTRLMWRVRCPGSGSVSAPQVGGELYLYPGNQQNTMCGSDSSEAVSNLGWGKWSFTADAKWHAIEQEVNPKSGLIAIWEDGRQVFRVTGADMNKVSIAGIFFSTFYGGDDTSWGPHTTETAEFGHFVLGNKLIPFKPALRITPLPPRVPSTSSFSSIGSHVNVASYQHT